MSKIAYDPVKDRFAEVIKGSRLLRSLFYRLLDLFFLRSWYVRRLLRTHGPRLDKHRWKLLDAGCGFGQYDHFILRTFRNVTVKAVDVKADYLDDCRSFFRKEIEKGRIEFEQLDLLELEEDAQHDFVLCVDVLEHIEEDVEVMKRLQKALKAGGLLLMHSPSHFAEEDAGEDSTFVDEHARTGYSKEEIVRKLHSAGFDKAEAHYTYGRWGHLAWEVLIKYPMLALNSAGMLALPFLIVYYALTLIPGWLLMKMDMRKSNRKGTGIYAIAEK